MSTQAIAKHHVSLYELENDLVALMDTDELVSEEQRQQFEVELEEALKNTVAKRDRLAGFISHCEQMQSASAQEIKRLQDRKKHFKSMEDRAREYAKRVIESLGYDEKGNTRKLEGVTATFSLRRNPAKLVITDEQKIADYYRDVSVFCPKPIVDWVIEQLDRIDDDAPSWANKDRPEREEFKAAVGAVSSINNQRIKRALEMGLDVPGADLQIDSTSVQVR